MYIRMQKQFVEILGVLQAALFVGHEMIISCQDYFLC